MNNTATVRVKLDSGTIEKARVIFYDATSGDTITTYEQTTDIPEELGIKTWTITETGIGSSGKVNVAPIIKTESGEDKLCQPTSAKFTCSVA